MPDITDIFDDLPEVKDASPERTDSVMDSMLGAPKAKTPTKAGKVPASNAADLGELVTKAVQAQDALEKHREIYETERAKLLAEIDQKLVHLRDPYEAAQKEFGVAEDNLLQAMKDADISEIPLSDRAPIKKKITKGSKKSCTKKHLEQTLGKPKAKEVWEKLERNPDKTTVIIPSRPAAHEI